MSPGVQCVIYESSSPLGLISHETEVEVLGADSVTTKMQIVALSF